MAKLSIHIPDDQPIHEIALLASEALNMSVLQVEGTIHMAADKQPLKKTLLSIIESNNAINEGESK